MGVPKFYRWISERYPCLSEVVKDYQIPEFDNLYLDMNGIIHVCSHPEDDNPHFRITEEKIFQDIFHYIEVLFRMIKPRKVFFMAVDGVAPRAKMNQQRGRRFRSAREAEMLVRKALEKGETLPSAERFDSNCITPGTEFMAKLQEQLKYFVVKKMSSDKLWQGPKVYLSGHETPGEGEHKVMDFIRYEKSQPDYDPNTRHCLYGLDADLMMLGLSSHEPHFSLLREEVRFGGKNSQKRSNAPEETTFHLLHLTLFREYLDYEFEELKDKLPFGYDLERIIDDWVLMGFLVGNDFIPHLPNMHIHHDALPTLWKNYKAVLPTLDGYLHDGGTLNLPRFEKFMCKLSEIDFDAFADKFSDLKWLESKSESKDAKNEANIRQRASVSSNDVGIPTANEFLALQNEDGEEEDLRAEMGAMTLEEFDEIEDDFMIEENSMLEKEFRSHKDAYYLNKMSLTASREVLQDQAENYVRAIQWILHYYFNGVPSWSWYYPYHYAPYLSDVCHFADMKMQFDMSRPFLSFQQLMAVLPSASKNIIPVPLQTLMLSENSPVIDYYPADFELDLNGKQQEWEAVVLIPFIDEERLLNAMAPLESKLTDEEKARNKHGPHTLFYYDPADLGIYQSSLIDRYPDSTVYNHHARICKIDKDLFRIPQEKIYKGLCKGASLDVYFPGFPTLKHLPHTAKLRKSGVKVFQMNSRGENMMLTLTGTRDQDIEQVAMDYLGKSVQVAWPHMIEARVVAVADGTTKFSLIENNLRGQEDRKNIQRHQMDQDESRTWARQVASLEDAYHDRKGVIIGDTNILVYATPMTGRKYVYNHSITLEKQWSSLPVPYALQATAKDIAVKAPSYKQYQTLEELFTPKTMVFMLGQPHYGCMGEILDVDPSNEGRIRVNFMKPYEPNLEGMLRQNERADRYMPGYLIAQKVGMSGFLVSRFTGILYISKGSKAHPPARDTHRTNVALNLKYNKTSMEVPGFTKKSETDNQWLYSDRVLKILLEYTRKYPKLFDYIATSNDDIFYEDDIFGEERGILQSIPKLYLLRMCFSTAKVKELKDYLKSLPCAEVAPAAQGTRIVHEEVVEGIEREVEKAVTSNTRRKRIKMQVKPHLLYRSLHAQANSVPDPTTTYELFDRVVNVREGFSVPLGERGTVIGIRAAAKEQDILYEVIFDEEFMGGLRIRCKSNKAYRVPATALINLTHGERKEEAKNAFKPTAVVKPQQGKTEGFRPAWVQNNQWAQSQLPQAQHQSQNTGPPHFRGQQNSRQTHPNNQQMYGGHQQAHSGSHQQMRGGGGGHQQSWRGGRGYQDYATGNQGGYYNNKQQGSESSGGHTTGRQTYHKMHQQQHPPHGQYNVEHGQPDWNQGQDQPTQEDDRFANIWKQLQNSNTPQTWHDKAGSSGSGASRNPLGHRDSAKSDPRHQPQLQRQTGPSLSEAAMALKVSQFPPGQQNANNNRGPGDLPSTTNNPASSHPQQSESQSSHQTTDVHQIPCNKPDSIPDKEDFNRLMAALHPNAGENQSLTKSSAQEGTEALQQLLRVQGNSEPGAPNQTNGVKPSYGKSVSVQDLFQGAKESVSDQKEKPSATQKGRQQKQNPVGALLDYCKSQGFLAPRYEYKYGRDNKTCCVVTMPDGDQFKGSYAKERQTAMDSAANNALNSLNLSGDSTVPGIFLDQKKVEQVDANFATSPNSAFTAVRGKGPMGMEFCFGSASSNKRGDPFPNPPPRPQQLYGHPQQAQLHTRQAASGSQQPSSDQYYHHTQPGDSSHRQHTSSQQGHHSHPQHHHHSKGYHHHQGYSAQQQSRSGGGGGFPQEHTSFKHQKGQAQHGQHHERYESDHDRARDWQDQGRRDNERSKDNPFVPLQVFKKQKTPVKSDQRESRHMEDNSNPYESVAGAAHLESPRGTNRHVTGDRASAGGSHKPQTPKSQSGGKKGKGSQKQASPDGAAARSSQPRRPKSRLAAKFT